MRIIVTGAGGFVGRKLVSKLSNHDIIALDQVSNCITQQPHVTAIYGDLCDDKLLSKIMADGCDAVVHLATVPGGAAEQNPSLAKRVNIDATMALAEAAANTGQKPRFIFASSIAVYGTPFPKKIDDATPLAPTMLYGVHKLMMEQWLATLTRRGEIDAISLRLSGVVARPKGPSGMKSAFMSEIFHALKSGQPFVVPVSENASSWLTSLDCAATHFATAIEADLSNAPPIRALTLPTLRVRIVDLVTEIASQTGQPIEVVSYQPDSELEAAFGALPPVTTAAAEKLGFLKNNDITSLVSNTLEELI